MTNVSFTEAWSLWFAGEPIGQHILWGQLLL